MTYLRDLATQAEHRLATAYTSHSGTDVAEAEVWRSVRDFYLMVKDGRPVEEALDVADARWKAYARENNAKVAAAPKIKRGPRQGQSCLEHRWVSPELFRSKAPHLRHMASVAVK